MTTAAPHSSLLASEPVQLKKVMGLSDVVMFYIAAVVGPRWIAVAAAAGPSSLVVWVGAALLFFVPLAFAVLELSSRFPEEGGLYIWSKRAFGDFSGFMTGWMYWASNLVYFPGLLYFAAGNALFIGGSSWQALSPSAPYFIVASLVGLAIAAVLNIIGLDVGKWLHNLGAYGTWIPIGLLIVMGLIAYAHFGSATSFTAETITPSTHLTDIIFWSTIAFGFGGLESASLMGEEIHDARRIIPRAVLIAGISVAAIYILGTMAILLALPKSEVSGLQGIMQAIAKTGDRVGFGAARPLAAVMITIGSLGGVGAWLAASGRLPFVAGIDKVLPPAFAKLHPKWRTPYVALIVQSMIAGVFAILGQAGTSVKGAYDVLVSLGVISFFIPYLFLFAALFKVQSIPVPPDAIRVPGGGPVARLMAVTGFAVTALSIGLSVIPSDDEPQKTLAVVKIVGLTLVLVVVGLVLYGSGRRRRVG